ncbi:SDR family oxidoreductase [Balamuthia mandrillaris]
MEDSQAYKVVVITGASQGIGLTLAQQLAASNHHQAEQQPKYKLVLAARSREALEEAANALNEQVADKSFAPVAVAVQADVSKREDHKRLLQSAIDAFGRVDVWVNNAGRGITKPVLELTDEDFDDMMLVNCKSVLYGMQTVVPYFKQQGRGHLINVSSVLGRLPFASIRSAYSAAKHAVNSLTCTMRMDLLREGFQDIHVTLFSPGAVATDFGLNALHGGPDNRQLPGAQPVEEVAEALVDAIRRPRADVYSREAYRTAVAAYYSAERVEEIEAKHAASPVPILSTAK